MKIITSWADQERIQLFDPMAIIIMFMSIASLSELQQ